MTSTIPNQLTPSQHEDYRRDGYLAPLTVLSPTETAGIRDRIFHLGMARQGRLPPALNIKAHLLVPALWQLVHDPRLVGPAADILGPDVLCWGSSFFDKAPGSPQRVHWHQDSTYWGLERPDALTAWVAFTPSDSTNGCLRVVPGTHHDQLQHVAAGDPWNMLAGDERLAETVDEAQAVDVLLRPGQMSLHHQRLIHGSRANTGTERRMGFAIRYIAGDLKGLRADNSFATLVRGRDLGGFQMEEAPHADMDPAALHRHATILRKVNSIIRREIASHGERESPDAGA